MAACEKLEKVLRAEKGNEEQGIHKDSSSNKNALLQKCSAYF